MESGWSPQQSIRFVFAADCRISPMACFLQRLRLIIFISIVTYFSETLQYKPILIPPARCHSTVIHYYNTWAHPPIPPPARFSARFPRKRHLPRSSLWFDPHTAHVRIHTRDYKWENRHSPIPQWQIISISTRSSPKAAISHTAIPVCSLIARTALHLDAASFVNWYQSPSENLVHTQPPSLSAMVLASSCRFNSMQIFKASS